jgi:hypothetical protein
MWSLRKPRSSQLTTVQLLGDSPPESSELLSPVMRPLVYWYASQAFPSWIFVVKVVKLRPVLVLLRDSAYAKLIRPLVLQDCRILVGTVTSASFAGTPMEKVKLGLIDGSPTSAVSGLLEGLGLTTIFYTKWLRQQLAGWNDVQTKIRHQEVGGVTHYNLQFGVLTKGKIPQLKPIGLIAPQDVSTVLSVMHPHYILRTAPGRRHIGDGECCNLGTEHRPFYHGGGWLPADLTPKTRVLTPQGSTLPRARGESGL